MVAGGRCGCVTPCFLCPCAWIALHRLKRCMRKNMTDGANQNMTDGANQNMTDGANQNMTKRRNGDEQLER